MVYWLLVEFLPVRLIALIVLIGLGLQFGGVDVFGMVTTTFVDPVRSVENRTTFSPRASRCRLS